MSKLNFAARYVIIGNSAAGNSAATAIRACDPAGDITIISEENYFAYSRPLISYFLKDKITLEKSALKESDFYEKNRIKVITGTKAAKIDKNKQTVILSDGSECPYDKLLLATGSVPFVPSIENMKIGGNVYTFMDYANAEKIKGYATHDHEAVILGGGLIGLKAAEGLQKICKKVTIVELADRLMPTVLDKPAGDILGNHLKANGISFILGTGITKAVYEKGSENVESVVLQNGESIKCDLLIVAAGVRPNVELAVGAGINVDRGIITDEKMETSVSGIFAAGDCTISKDLLDNKLKMIALWPNAVEQGEVAGKAMTGEDAVFEGSFAMNAIDFFGLRIMTAGLINATGDEYDIRVVSGENSYRKIIIRDDRLVGYIIIGDAKRAGIYTSLIAEKTPLSLLDKDILDEISMLAFDIRSRQIRLDGGEK